ncbi:hypothetical protein ACKC9G_15915 [Pokkaliibacter sp. CJK22405]|uniref:hypothetical protein n=1 Tax=Pokkaliibacter sp. CJK22405 TaxID=3384615 RepID=UPI003984D39A
MLNAMDRDEFVRSALDKVDALITWEPGLAICCQNGQTGWGMALTVQANAQSPDMAQETLSRRFEDAYRFRDCYVSMNGKQTLILWHSWPKYDHEPGTPQRMMENLVALAGLPFPDLLNEF